MFRYIATIFLIGLLSTSANFQDSKLVLSEIDNHKFGNTMLSMIALNMNAKNDDESILGVIDQVIENLQSKQDKVEKTHAINQKDCKETLLALSGQIAETKGQIKELEETIADQKEILAQAQSDLKQAKEDYDETMEAIEVGTKTRTAQHQKWANEDYDQTIQITTLDEGTKLINHMLHGVAFNQLETRYTAVVDKLKSSQGQHAGLFKPLVASLTQLATKLNYENVMNILKLLGDIRASIVQSQQEARTAEEKSQAAWEKRLKILETQKKQLEDKKKRLQSLIGSCQAVINSSEIKLETATFNLSEFERSKANKEAQCAKWEADYKSTSEEIDRELEILDQLRTYVASKNKQIEDYVAKRAANRPKL